MGVFDTIYGEPVKCYSCELINYSIGDEVPNEHYGYSLDLNIFSFQIMPNKFYCDSIIIIRDNKVKEIISVENIEDKHFDKNVQCISFDELHTHTRVFKRELVC